MSKTTQFTDNDMIEGLRGGDSTVMKALYKKYYNLVLKFVVNNSGSEEAARDIYQEAIIVLYENTQRPDFVLSCQLQTYIYSVVRRLWLKELRKNGKTTLFKEDAENEVADVGPDLQAYNEKEQHLVQLSQSMSELGEPCATLIRDFYVNKMSMDAIADKFGYTNADNAKNQKYKCLQRLKKYFYEKKDIVTE